MRLQVRAVCAPIDRPPAALSEPMLSDLPFRRKECLGRFARSNDPLAIIATRLVLLLRSIIQDVLRTAWLLARATRDSTSRKLYCGNWGLFLDFQARRLVRGIFGRRLPLNCEV